MESGCVKHGHCVARAVKCGVTAIQTATTIAHSFQLGYARYDTRKKSVWGLCSGVIMIMMMIIIILNSNSSIGDEEQEDEEEEAERNKNI